MKMKESVFNIIQNTVKAVGYLAFQIVVQIDNVRDGILQVIRKAAQFKNDSFELLPDFVGDRLKADNLLTEVKEGLPVIRDSGNRIGNCLHTFLFGENGFDLPEKRLIQMQCLQAALLNRFNLLETAFQRKVELL